jgi:hypothetical protein
LADWFKALFLVALPAVNSGEALVEHLRRALAKPVLTFVSKRNKRVLWSEHLLQSNSVSEVRDLLAASTLWQQFVAVIQQLLTAASKSWTASIVRIALCKSRCSNLGKNTGDRVAKRAE